jgi:hypothetical protein
MPNINFPRRRSPLQDLYQLPSQTTGVDLEPQPMMMPQMQLPPMESLNTDGLENLARMGTQRAIGPKKKKPQQSLMDNEFLKSFLLS